MGPTLTGTTQTGPAETAPVHLVDLGRTGGHDGSGFAGNVPVGKQHLSRVYRLPGESIMGFREPLDRSVRARRQP